MANPDQTIPDPARVNGRWVFPDGTSLPVVRGGDGPDFDAGGDAGGAPADINSVLDRIEAGQPDIDPGTGNPVAAEAAVDVQASVDADPAAPMGQTEPTQAAADPAAAQDSGWLAQQTPEVQEYVQRLRSEAASNRVRARDVESAFEGFAPEGRDFILDLARDIQANPEQALARAQQLVEFLGESVGAPADAAAGANVDVDAAAIDPDAPLTAAQLQELLDKRDRQAEQRRQEDEQIQQIVKSAEDLGYKPDTPDYMRLLWQAVQFNNGNIAAADKALKAERQKIIDDYVAEKAKQQDGAPVTSPQTGGAPTTEKPIRNLKDARAALEESLAAQYGSR